MSLDRRSGANPQHREAMVRTQGNNEIRLVLLKDVLAAEREGIQVGGGQRGGREVRDG